MDADIVWAVLTVVTKVICYAVLAFIGVVGLASWQACGEDTSDWDN